MFLLKARRPAQYKDRAVHEHTGAAGGAVQFESRERSRRTPEAHQRNRRPDRERSRRWTLSKGFSKEKAPWQSHP